MKNVLVLGGAGFIGSNIVKAFFEAGYKVTVIDAFYDFTGAKPLNLKKYRNQIKIIKTRVEDCVDIKFIINENDLIIDCMGWTAHHEAINNPYQDIQLNLISHLKIIEALKGTSGKNIIYLGSRGQYGNTESDLIKEDQNMFPEDVQGINKSSAEHYYRVYSKFYNFNIISLRLPNCYGENQVFNSKDIGLIGGFIKDAIKNKEIEVYGNHRKRSILYVKDISSIIFRIKDKIPSGFTAINVNGITIEISELAKKIIELTKSGSLSIKSIPENVRKIDMGSASLDETKLKELIGEFQYIDIDLSLMETINYFNKKL